MREIPASIHGAWTFPPVGLEKTNSPAGCVHASPWSVAGGCRNPRPP